MFIKTLNYIGGKSIFVSQLLFSEFLKICTNIGEFLFFLGTALKVSFTTPLKINQLFEQLIRVGVDSSTIIFLTGFSTGLALALQTYIGFHRFGIEEFLYIFR